MSLDLDRTLEQVRDKQWSLGDIDWDAPGAERIRDDQRESLRNFMADLVWIEHVGARGFAALADKAHDPVLAEIYRWFHAEEQRHANAELALMRRWGMLADGEMPEVNANIRLVIDFLDQHASATSLGMLSAVIAMLETALDAALVQFLLEEVDDPVCHDVFALINRDEARHIAVDFEVLEQLGMRPRARGGLVLVARTVNPRLLIGVLVYLPLLNRMRDNLAEFGLDEERLYRAIRRFDAIGSRSPAIRGYAPFQLMRTHGRMVVDRSHPYHLLADALVAVTRRIPPRLLGPLPSWVDDLTSEPTA